MKKIFLLILVFVFGLSAFGGCKSTQSDNLIVASLFPQYSFAKAIAGDKFEVKLLLKAGTSAHHYDPSVSDVYDINRCALFIHSGENNEPWAVALAKNRESCDASKGIELKQEYGHDEHNHEHEDHEHAFDTHYWLDPNNALIMITNVLDAIVALDSENEQEYKDRANELIASIKEYNANMKAAVDDAKARSKCRLVFGGAFAYLYFLDCYGIEFETAYSSCSTDVEPSPADIARVIEYARRHSVSYIFHEELSQGTSANLIAQSLGAKKAVFHTAHNLSEQDFSNNKTFIDIMNANLSILIEAWS